MASVESRRAFEEEKARRASMDVFDRVNEQLERRANQVMAMTLSDEEQTRRVMEDREIEAQENEERSANVRMVDRMVLDEKCRRETLGLPTHEKFFARLPAVANDAARSVLKKEVLAAEEGERLERVVCEKKGNLVTTLERAFTRARADRSMEKERVRRIASDNKLDVFSELERVANKKSALQAQEVERQRQIVAMADSPSPELADAKSTLNERIVSAYSKREALRAENLARLEHLLETVFETCVYQATRKANQKEADRSADREQRDRVLRGTYSSVAAASAEASRRRQVTAVVRETQKQLVAEQAAAIKAREACGELAEILCAIERRGNQREADASMAGEQERRVISETKQRVLGDLERTVAWRRTRELVDLEVASIAHARLQAHVVDEIELRASSRRISQMVEAERERLCKNWLEPESKADDAGASRTGPLPSEVLEAIERLGNQRAALRAMDREQESKVVQRLYARALQDLERTVAWREALGLLEEEVARVRHQQGLCRALEQLGAEFRRAEARTLVEQERAELVQANPSRKEVNADLLESIERRGNQRSADLSMDLERERRVIAEVRVPAVCEQLVRTVNIRRARELSLAEQMARVTRMKAERVFEELGQKRRRSEARCAVEAERAERLAGMQEQMALRQSSNVFQALLNEIDRDARIKGVDAAMAIEQQERINRDKLDAVFQDLLRALNRAAAIAAADGERAERVAATHKNRAMDELVRRTNQRAVDALVAAEAAARIDEAPLALKTRSAVEALYSVLEDVERVYNRGEALRAMDLERQRRLLVTSFDGVVRELEKTMNARSADRAMDAERVLRSAQSAFQAVLGEFERVNNRDKVDRAVAAEREEQVKAGFTALVESGHSLSECHRQLVSKASWKATSQQVEELRESYELLRRAARVQEEIVRRASAREAERLYEHEKARFVHQSLLEIVLAELARNAQLKALSVAVEEERTRRTADAATRAMKFAALARNMLSEISAGRSGSSNMGFLVVDSADDWATVSPATPGGHSAC